MDINLQVSGYVEKLKSGNIAGIIAFFQYCLELERYSSSLQQQISDKPTRTYIARVQEKMDSSKFATIHKPLQEIELFGRQDLANIISLIQDMPWKKQRDDFLKDMASRLHGSEQSDDFYVLLGKQGIVASYVPGHEGVLPGWKDVFIYAEKRGPIIINGQMKPLEANLMNILEQKGHPATQKGRAKRYAACIERFAQRTKAKGHFRALRKLHRHMGEQGIALPMRRQMLGHKPPTGYAR